MATAAEPVPWATGLSVTALVAVLTAALDITLTGTLVESFARLALPANAVLGLGLAPSIWISRRVPFWRWIGVGAALGLVAGWLGLALRALV